ncbi:MAG: NADH-quinone oxidoreductase subunit NuoH [Deltaproteobacteria bacterium]|jgi:NADH-quinone oxidoreductase subunit H|nr:NADH-quinone oxidoreductase subunit NuoH [Deltaproteobacteria bacterium]
MSPPETLVDKLDSPWLGVVLGVAAVLGMLTVNVLFLVWLERKVSAWIQRRMGPTEVGPFGLFQTLADMLKLLSKQLITPRHVDKPLYHLAPLVVFVPVVAAASLFPFSAGLVLQDLDIGLVLVFAFGGLAFVGIFMAGWGSNNKYALLGAMRSVAQNISYEIPLILASLSVVLMSGTMNLAKITALQSERGYWFIVLQPVAAVIYFIAALAETNRAPFDIPEAESELVAGFHTEYSGMRFALFFFAEYSNVFIVSMVATVLFLGGWSGPLLPGPVWFFLKVYALVGLTMWVRWTFPRLRFDQLMSFCWVVLTPLAILNLLITAFVARLV